MALAGLLAFTSNALADTARGVVFHDVDGDGQLDEGESPIPGVGVSNGVAIVETDENGRYELEIDGDAVIFVIKPTGWRTPLSETMLPRFYYVHRPNGSPDLEYGGFDPTGPLPEAIDFPLYPQEEPTEFRTLMFGDTQSRDRKEIDYLARDIIEGLIGSDAAFGVTLGDVAFNDLSIYESQVRELAKIGVPWYNVPGNHDANFDSPDQARAYDTFTRVLGPSHYSYNYGPVHFIVVNDIEWVFKEGADRPSYRGGIGEDQLEFIQNDLASTPEERLVVLMMHIPITSVHDREPLYRLIEKRSRCISISGHTHTHEQHFLKAEDGWRGATPHHHIVNVTACGSWWRGAPDERGIPCATMADGAPNGYSIMTFDGDTYVLDFRAASKPADYQMDVHSPESVPADKLAETDVLVNVFNGSERSTVLMRVDDSEDWIEMERTSVADPAFVRDYESDKAMKTNAWMDLPSPHKSTHIWKGRLPEGLEKGVHELSVKTTDMHGRVYIDGRTFRVE